MLIQLLISGKATMHLHPTKLGFESNIIIAYKTNQPRKASYLWTKLNSSNLENHPKMPPNTPIFVSLLFLIFPFFIQQSNAYMELRPDFYDESCPRLPMIIRYHIWAAVQNDSRMAASLLRLNFHDCIVDVCKVHYLPVVNTITIMYLVGLNTRRY